MLGFLPQRFTAFGWHSYEATLPPGATALAHSDICLQAYRVGEAAWGIQFHAEVSPADLEHWTVNYEEDPDAIAIGLDPEALGRRNAEEIERWNDTRPRALRPLLRLRPRAGSVRSDVGAVDAAVDHQGGGVHI